MRNYMKLLPSAMSVMFLGGLSITQAQSLNSQDREFIQDASKGGMMEVHMGRLGKERGTSEAVKNFSQRVEKERPPMELRYMKDIADDRGLDWEYTERVLSSRDLD